MVHDFVDDNVLLIAANQGRNRNGEKRGKEQSTNLGRGKREHIVSYLNAARPQMVLNGSGSINKVSAREHQDLLLSPSIILGALTEYDFANRSSVQPYPRILPSLALSCPASPGATKLKHRFDGVGR